MIASTKIGTNGYGGYFLGDYDLFSGYNKTDKEGNSVDGYCWYVKSDLDSEENEFVAESLEECIEWVFEQIAR